MDNKVNNENSIEQRIFIRRNNSFQFPYKIEKGSCIFNPHCNGMNAPQFNSCYRVVQAVNQQKTSTLIYISHRITHKHEAGNVNFHELGNSTLDYNRYMVSSQIL